MEDQLDLELGQDALERTPIEDRPGDLAIDLRGNRSVERRKVERDNGEVGTFGQTLDQAVADLAVRTGDEDDRFPHAQNYTEACCCSLRCW